MNRFTLLLGGDLVRTPRLDAQIAGTRIIAADSGMRHAVTLDVLPELWVGDFDSVSLALLKRYGHVPQRTYPPEKDMTDGELAVSTALEAGAESLLLAGAFGGERADHAFLHIAAAIRLLERGVVVTLTSGNQEGTPLPLGRTVRFDYPSGTVFSVIGLTDLGSLTLSGAHWRLTEADIPFGSAITLSNRVENGLAVTLGSGRAMLIAHLGNAHLGREGAM